LQAVDCDSYLNLSIEKATELLARQREVASLFSGSVKVEILQQILRDIFLEIAELGSLLTEAKKVSQ
jgi:hypothetical protein